ncbi:alpha/beta hydrolase [Umezawaea sp.]|uniref:alpha/beta fold hydrolase n=1 Tax=Umezawaea sp. TaxID=1955258 RepID=UPI002ED39E5A
MTTVFVHGVPETPDLWDDVRAHLPGDTVALRLPGFGGPRPEGVRDKDDHARWLADALREIDGPIDLVGHDWGAHLVYRVVTAFDVPLRSWVADVAHGWHPDHEWHDAAKLWQTPAGEESLAGLREAVPGSGRTFGDLLRPRGMTARVAAAVDAAHDVTMSRAILDLYRSAVPNLHADWGTGLDRPARVPGLVLIPAGDPFGGAELDVEVATRLGARWVELDGLTHYWMLQDPARVAAVLRGFHESVGAAAGLPG